jgi:hypothetical protein
MSTKTTVKITGLSALNARELANVEDARWTVGKTVATFAGTQADAEATVQQRMDTVRAAEGGRASGYASLISVRNKLAADEHKHVTVTVTEPAEEILDCITCTQPVDPTKNYNRDQHADCEQLAAVATAINDQHGPDTAKLISDRKHNTRHLQVDGTNDTSCVVYVHPRAKGATQFEVWAGPTRAVESGTPLPSRKTVLTLREAREEIASWITPEPEHGPVTDPAAWTTDNGRKYVHAGLPGWELIAQRHGRILVKGLRNGQPAMHGVCNTLHRAVELAARRACR